jgi:predicted nucleic acid-binding protein
LSTLLLDASVWLAALDADDASHSAATTLLEGAATGTVSLAALDLTLYEVANVAAVRWKSAADAERLIELVQVACADALERADDALLAQAVAVAIDHELTVYDAAYVAASRRRDWPLVSADVADLVAPGLALSPEAAVAETARPAPPRK